MRNSQISSLTVASFAIAAFTVQANVAAAQNYEGKTLQMVIASNAGGGTDRIARLFGLYLEQ